MELDVRSSSGQSAGSVTVADATFDRAFSEPLVHQVVTAYMAGARTGTRAQKTRSDVRGGGAKPFRQKGTGRARAGTIRSPIWRGGGVTFAARPQDHSQKVNKKMYRAAMQSILSELVRQERFCVVDQLQLAESKTKKALALLADLGVDQGSVLFVIDQPNLELELATRNLIGVAVSTVSALDPVSLVGSEKVVVSQAALQQIEEWLS